MIVIHSSILHLYLTGLRSTRSSSNQLIDWPKPTATQKNKLTARNNYHDVRLKFKTKKVNEFKPLNTHIQETDTNCRIYLILYNHYIPFFSILVNLQGIYCNEI